MCFYKFRLSDEETQKQMKMKHIHAYTIRGVFFAKAIGWFRGKCLINFSNKIFIHVFEW